MSPSHPNRGARTEASNPTPDQIKAARGTMTQKAAADLIHGTERAWQEWEAGNRRMHPGLWELFQIKRREF
jgi:DNA-binding transcriptional regulator YiaG